MRLFFTCLFTILSVSLFGKGVTGIVTDGKEPLPGASIVVKGTSNGVVTNLEGYFSLKTEDSDELTLVISYLGYQPEEIQVSLKNEWQNLGTIILKEENTELETTTVVATFREGETKSVHMTKMDPALVTITSSETIQKLPDRNVADAVMRLSAVSVQRDQGEGRFVSVRGTPKDWNSMLINGDRLPAANEMGDTRAVALDFFPSEMIQYIKVAKALQPEYEADAIGASVQFITKLIPENKTFQLRAGAGYNAQAAKPMSNIGMDWGGRSKNKRFGYLVNLNYFQRFWATDNYQTVFASNYNQSVNRLELRRYDGLRNTFGGHINLDYRINEHYTMFGRFYNGFLNDNEWNRKTMYRYATGTGSTAEVQSIRNIMNTLFIGGDIGGKWQKQLWELEWKVASYSSTFQYGPIPFSDRDDMRNGYFVTRFIKPNVAYLDQVFVNQDGALDLFKLLGKDQIGSFGLDTLNTPVGLILVPDEEDKKGEGDKGKSIFPVLNQKLSAEDFDFYEAYTEYRKNVEKDPAVFQLDIRRRISSGFQLKAGVKQRYKTGERIYNITTWRQDITDPESSASIPLSSLPTATISGSSRFLNKVNGTYGQMLYPFLTKDATEQLLNTLDNRIYILPDSTLPIEEAINRQSNNYSYRENVAAAYVSMLWSPSEKLKISGGVRLEHTHLQVEATDVSIGIDSATGYLKNFTVGAIAKKNYLSWFPSMNVLYAPVSDLNIRVAAYRSMRRPNFNEVKPGAALIDVTNFTRDQGNPDLKPAYAWNVDWTTEYYFGNKGYISAGVFYKKIQDNIFTTNQGDSDNRFGYVNRGYANAESAWLAGIELILNRRFDFLPGFLSGFGIQSNYTFVHSRMETPGRTIAQALPEQAPHIFNVSLYYEKNKVSTRIGFNYKSAYLVELNTFPKDPSNGGSTEYLHDNTDYDIFARDMISMDYSCIVKLGNKWQIIGEVSNLLNSPYLEWRGEKFRAVKTEYYNIRAMLNLKYTF